MNKKQYMQGYLKSYRAKHKEKLNKASSDYHKSWDGWLSLTYSHMKERSIKRKHPLPDFSKEQLWWWMYDNCRERFIRMHAAWTRSGFDRNLKPSIDRKDDRLPYILSNIRLVLWKTNNKKGALSKQQPVQQLHRDFNLVIKCYASIAKAAKKIKRQPTAIISAMNRSGLCANYRWQRIYV